MKSLPLIALGAGMLLLVASFLWPTIFPAENTWTDKKSELMSEVGSQAHKLHLQLKLAQKDSANLRPGQDMAQLEADYASVTAKLDAMRSEFESAAEAPQFVATILKWSGIALAAVGAFGVFAAGASDP